MGELLTKMFELLLEGNKEKRQSRLFHFKSFVIFVISAIIYEILDKNPTNIER